MRRDRAFVGIASLLGWVLACGDAFMGTDGLGGAGTGGVVNGAGSSSRAGSAAGGEHAEGGSLDGDAGESAGGEPVVGTDGGAPSAGAAGSGGNPVEPTPCQTTSQCEPGANCIDEACAPALATCAAQKNKYPASKDGVYWLVKGANAQRVYCDMAEAIELCSEVEGQHQGRTRDSSKLEYSMTSVLLPDLASCKMWAIRAVADGYPLWKLEAKAGVPEGQTCIKLGFAADGTLGTCNYGSMRSDCGFMLDPLNRYGNTCSGCVLNDGDFDHWLLQGPVKVGAVLSNVSGSAFTTCKTSK